MEPEDSATGLSPESDGSGPSLAVAAICEHVLIEEDGVASLIRIVDRFSFAIPPKAPPEAMGIVEAFMFFKFLPGSFQGTAQFRVDQVTPSGERREGIAKPLQFEEGRTGVQLRAKLEFLVAAPGTYWMEGFLNGQLVSRLPIQILIQRDGPAADEAAISTS